MTQEVFTPTPLVTISGTGPYTILHGYDDGSLVVAVLDDDTRTVLSPSDYTVSPVTTSEGGALTLTAGAATTHAGKKLEITRDTVLEQGFAGQTSREVGLEAQLDWIVRAAQDLRRAVKQTLRTSSASIGFLPLDRAERVLGFDAEGQPIAGPTFGAIEGAQAAATAAAASATAAAASALAALATETAVAAILDTFDDRYLGLKATEPTTDNDGNPLVAGALYFNSTTNMMRIWNGSAWQNFGNDISLAVLKVNNLSDLPNPSVALDNLGASAAGKTILTAATAALQRTALGLGGLATLNILDEDDFVSDDPTRPPSQKSAGAYARARSLPFTSGPTDVNGLTSLLVADIPAGVNLVRVIGRGISHNSDLTTGDLLIQIGGASLVTSGYNSSATTYAVTRSATAGFMFMNPGAAAALDFQLELARTPGTNIWAAYGQGKIRATATRNDSSGDPIAIFDTLQRLSLTTVGGTAIYDAGNLSVFAYY